MINNDQTLSKLDFYDDIKSHHSGGETVHSCNQD